MKSKQNSGKHGVLPVRENTGDADAAAGIAWSNMIRMANSGQTEQALHLLASSQLQTDAARNARGVCLLRLGRTSEALSLYRSLVFPHDCTWMKPDVPVIYRTNCCLALLLAGHPCGCRDLLNDMAEKDHPAVLRMQVLLNTWQQSLTFWQRLLWRVGIEPAVAFTAATLVGDIEDSPLVTNTTAGAGPTRNRASQAV